MFDLRSQMSEMNRQQNLLRRELLGIKLEKIKAIMSNHSSQSKLSISYKTIFVKH